MCCQSVTLWAVTFRLKLLINANRGYEIKFTIGRRKNYFEFLALYCGYFTKNENFLCNFGVLILNNIPNISVMFKLAVSGRRNIGKLKFKCYLTILAAPYIRIT